MSKCPSCHEDNPPGVRFCGRCGGVMPADPVAGVADPPPPGDPSLAPWQASASRWQAPAAPLNEQEVFLNGFSWAPGCGFYLWSKAMSRFLILGMLLNMCLRLLEAVVGDNPDDATAIGAFLAFLVLLALDYGLMVWAGKVSRRRRWEMLTWTDWEQFRMNELAWNRAGIIGWVVSILIPVGAIIIGVVEGLKGF